MPEWNDIVTTAMDWAITYGAPFLVASGVVALIGLAIRRMSKAVR